MKKKLGRTFAEATNEYEAEHGNLKGYHRDIDEVLADKSLQDALDKMIKELPGGERGYWEDTLKMNLELFGESEWTRRIRESLETGKFPPERYTDMTNDEWCEKYGAIRDRFMEHYSLNVYRGFTGMTKEGCWCSGWTGEEADRPESAIIGLMLNEPIKVDDTFEGIPVYQWKTPGQGGKPERIK